MFERTRLHEQYLVQLIKNSQSSDISELIATPNINCYAFARHLTYQDEFHSIYTPGMIHNIQFDHGPIILSQTNFNLLEYCLLLDSKALEQKTKKIFFDDIKENDGYSYIGICYASVNKLNLGKQAIEILKNYNICSTWHFICRTKDGIWMHKPNWDQPVETIIWKKFGKQFFFQCSTNIPNFMVEAKCTCKKDYFYQIET